MSTISIKKYLKTKNINNVSIVLFATSIVLGFVYLIVPSYNLFWNFSGIVYLTTLFYSFFHFYFISNRLNKTVKFGKRINLLYYVYLLFLSISMLLMMFGNFFISSTYSNAILDKLHLYFVVYGGFFGPLIIGLVISVFIFKNVSNNEFWIEHPQLGQKSTVRRIIDTIFSLIFIGLGSWLASVVVFGTWEFIGLFIAELALGFSFIFFAGTLVIYKDLVRKSHKIFLALSIIGLFTSIMLFLPYALTTVAIVNAEENFAEAFGEDWRDEIPKEVEQQYFMNTQYSTLQYFLGISSEDYKVIKNVRYFSGKQSNFKVDENITLYFDVYMPKYYTDDLPGHNSTLVRIHGGSWRSYDKGMTNWMQMNKYFAAQGYIVFDIQYGLRRPDRNADALTPLNVLGDFDIDDMVRHIGEFTKFVSTNNNYGANLNSVFISGGSAGGHLSCAVGLAIESGEYNNLFSSEIRIKGLIPFYPANLLPVSYGSLKLVRPEYLVKSNSPPSLVFQGYQDGLVNWKVSERWKNTYTAKGNQECAIIYLPLCGHSNDLYFSGHFNMVFLYYHERFMYIYQ